MCCGEFDLPKIDRRLILKTLGILTTSPAILLGGCTNLPQRGSDKFSLQALSFQNNNVEELRRRLTAKGFLANPQDARTVEVEGLLFNIIPYTSGNNNHARLVYGQYNGVVEARAAIFLDNKRKVIDLKPGKPDYMVELLQSQRHTRAHQYLRQSSHYQAFREMIERRGLQIAESETKIYFDGGRYKAVLFLYRNLPEDFDGEWPTIPDAIGLAQWSSSSVGEQWRLNPSSPTQGDIDIQYLDPGDGGGGSGGSGSLSGSSCGIWSCIKNNPFASFICGITCTYAWWTLQGDIVCLACMIAFALCAESSCSKETGEGGVTP
jgi:hypothetical protein